MFQGNYYSEPYGKRDTETAQARSPELAENYWNLSVKLISDTIGEDYS